MTSIYSASREDLYDFMRCPKIVAIKAHRALTEVREPAPPIQRKVEPATLGKIGEAAVKLGFAGIPLTTGIQQIARIVPDVNLNEHLLQIAQESLRGAEQIRHRLAEEYGEITIIGKGQGRHPDLAAAVMPDFIAFAEGTKQPIIVEVKGTAKPTPADDFQAKYYNGVAEQFGVYLLERRLEREAVAVSPELVRGAAETVLVYPRRAEYKVVREAFAPDRDVVRELWRAKELGFKGQMPEADCPSKCPHSRFERNLKSKLVEGNMEPIPPLALTFSDGIVEQGYSLDLEYQVNYARGLLPAGFRYSILLGQSGFQGVESDVWRNWLVEVVGLDSEAAETALNLERLLRFHGSRPSSDELLASLGSEVEAWKAILKQRMRSAAPAVLGRATSIYSLPRRSAAFVKDAVKRWRT